MCCSLLSLLPGSCSTWQGWLDVIAAEHRTCTDRGGWCSFSASTSPTTPPGPTVSMVTPPSTTSKTPPSATKNTSFPESPAENNTSPGFRLFSFIFIPSIFLSRSELCSTTLRLEAVDVGRFKKGWLKASWEDSRLAGSQCSRPMIRSCPCADTPFCPSSSRKDCCHCGEFFCACMASGSRLTSSGNRPAIREKMVTPTAQVSFLAE
mmetsp:Transcript_52499/g.139315  ORF Transcript_52499/g.139315 Transcript_52499/m.139315 type:complete len:207 (-) Transcript_52499:568-1188(-)